MRETRDRLIYVCVAAATALVAVLAWRSLEWPLIRDAPIMHYVAWLITQGEVPYRDVFDMNLPGVYLLHVGFLRVFGASPLGWRIVDLAWMLATASALFVYCRGFADRWSAAAAAALFALYHLADGPPQAGQRDYLLCIFLIAGAYGISRSWETGGRLAPAWWGGLAVGAGLTIKPFPVFFWVACVAMAALAARRINKRAMVSVAGAFVAGSAIVPACVYGWLAVRGGLDAFVDILGRYLPLYGQTDRASLQAAVSYAIYHLFPALEFGLRGERLLRLASIAAFLVFSGMLVAAPLRRGAGVRERFALIGLTYGVLHYFIQGRAWPYHMYPMVLFFCVVMSIALTGDRQPSLQPVEWSRRRKALRPVALSFLVLAIAGLGRRGLYGTEGINGTDVAGVEENQRVEEMVADLRAAVPSGDTVQIMDTKGWAIDALLRLHLRQPTRFIYDFHFFHHQGTPYIRNLREEFVTGVAAGRPAVILISPDYQRLAEFPDFGALLARSYRVSVDNGHYRIYTRTPDHRGRTL
jgi:hypothetical protein